MLSCSSSKVKCSESLNKMIKSFQQYFDLNETGILDAATLAVMKLPRCAIVDKPSQSRTHQLMSTIWPRFNLKYRIDSYVDDISESQQINLVEDAFNEWSKHTPLKFARVCDDCTADIVLGFENDDHGDAYPFDAQSVAHAFQPHDSRIHLNYDAKWTDSFNSTSNTEVNMFLIVLHGIGHALGLDHIKSKQSIMHPNYQLKQRSEVLAPIDQTNIQYLYGKNDADTYTCAWEGHCPGDDCLTEDDCDGNLVCNDEVCTITKTKVGKIPKKSLLLKFPTDEEATSSQIEDILLDVRSFRQISQRTVEQ
ncbi:unnamed protein product [Didymodactylos carnosus]|uniref:Peptidase metallopeptidase domain-containing protein n=1 Tax=Didymodactylos carnosus TaxID=1234261 RepID=A0A814DIH3_9BILA|nr:unnamed protein product [Didymodactylos carnosus]CAF3732382.1 unnamed protein product [Didymodactylos carnosus]